MLKNIFLTAALVVGGTMATAALTMMGTLLVAAHEDLPSDAGTVMFGIYGALVMSTIAGAIFSVVTLPMAALTMPPTLAFARLFKLPRPLTDIFGGALAALPCVWAVLGMLESLAQAKGGSAPNGEMRFLFEACALIGGGLVGYARHAILVKARSEPAPPVYA